MCHPRSQGETVGTNKSREERFPHRVICVVQLDGDNVGDDIYGWTQEWARLRWWD